MARVAAHGVSANPMTFHAQIPWWIRRAELVDEVNTKRTNSQYLPGARMPMNLQATTDLQVAAEGANICIVALPAQFVGNSFSILQQVLAPNAVVVSLTKSLKIKDGRPAPYSDLIQAEMPDKRMAALMGPNIYSEMARDEFAEATIGCADPDLWPVLKQLFETPLFHVQLEKDLASVEMCGCLKNTITISCGIAKGLGYGANVQAAIMRRGLLEIGAFMKEFFNTDQRLLLQACGVGDVVLSCMAGRGQQLARAFVENKGEKDWEQLENEIMNGMKLPDHHNVKAIHDILSRLPKGLERYPLLAMTHDIAFGGVAPENIVEALRTDPAH